MSAPCLLDGAELGRHPLPKIAEDDKAGHGTLLLVAGSRDVPGAVLLAGEAAMRAGAGRLQCIVPEPVAIPLGIALPFAMVAGFAAASDGGLSDEAVRDITGRIEKVDAVVAGPGMKGNPTAAKLAEALLACGTPLALDAALLHALPAKDDESR